MKKLLLVASAFVVSLGLQAQAEMEAVMENNYTGLNLSVASAETVNDTLTPPVLSGCDQAPRTYGAPSFGYLTGTNTYGATQIAQWLNIDSADVQVYSFLVFCTNKDEGPTPGDFSAMLYSSTDSLTPGTVMATSNPVSIGNIDTVNTWTTFAFANPVNVGPTSFFAALEIENGSDTISVATTGPNCAGGTSLFYNDTSWTRIRNAFTTGGASLDPVIYMFAEVETSGSVGMDRHLISRSGVEFYPNPAQNQASIQFDMNDSKVSLFVQDMSGRTVYTNDYNLGSEKKIELDLSTFNSGMYTYQIVGSKKQLNGVFVKK